MTYDALRRVEREENTSPRLTSLPSRFWQRLGDHLNELRDAFQGQQEEDPTARRTVVLADELRNTQRLAESIWALREKKVVQAALGSVRRRDRDKEASVPANATKEERDLFVSVIGVMTTARDEAAITDPFSRKKRDRQAQEAKAEQAVQEGQKGVEKTTGGVPAHGTDNRSGPTQAGRTDPGAATPADPGRGPPAVAVASAQDERKHEGRPAQQTKAAGGTADQGSGATGGSPATVPGPTASGRGQAGEERGEKSAEEGGEESDEKSGEKAHERGGGVGASGEQEMELRLVEALKPVPIFAGPDLVTYELGEGEVGNLPARAAELLERRGVVRLLPAK